MELLLLLHWLSPIRFLAMSDKREEQMANAEVEEISGEIVGQKFSLRSVALNTLATVATLTGVVVISILLWQHQIDAKEAGKGFVEALKEQTVAMRESTQVGREQNCLLRFDQKERQSNAEFCRQITR